jgi:hypothetical protein
MIENIKTPQHFLTLFPDAKDVFAAPVEKYAQHIQPLLSIDLKAVNQHWHGKIHLVLPMEPHDGMMGEYTPEFHNDYLKPNWIAFKLNLDFKYEILGDLHYFALENFNFKEPYPDYKFDLNAHYDRRINGLAQAKARFEKYGVLYSGDRDKPLEKSEHATEPSNILDQLGGNIGYANWTSYCQDLGIKLNIDDLDEAEADAEAEHNVYPISPNGNRFYFVASVPKTNYISNVHYGSLIVLFYEPIERIVWLTFDYS